MARPQFNSNSKRQEELPKAKLNSQSLKQFSRILAYLQPYKYKYGLSLVMLTFESVASLAFPLLLGKLIGVAVQKNEVFYGLNLNGIALALGGFLLAQALFSFARIFLMVQIGENALADLRSATFTHIIQLPMSFFVNNRVGELQSRISADLSQIQDTITASFAQLIRQIITLLGGLALLFMLSGKLTIMMLGTFPLLIGAALVFGKYIRKIAAKAQDRLADTNTVVEETLQGITTVKAFANEWYETARYRKSMREVVKLATKSAVFRGAFAAFFIFVVSGGIVAIIWVGATMVNGGTLKLDALMSFILYSAFVGGSMASFADLYAQIQKTIGATERVFQLLDTDVETLNLTHPSPNDYHNAAIKGNLELKNVSFFYPMRPADAVLENISFDVMQGERIALVGTSGAGKTTITNLLLRLYEVSGGSILLDGKPLNEYALTDLRRQMALVPQDVVLFGSSIRENIAYGNPDASLEQIKDAAQKAFATEFIEAIPEQYEALVGERGIKLSGGQRQRIAIARAILRNPKILILDEATSALDSQSERVVQLALNDLMQNRTSIIVAHRLSTIRSADKIAVIDQGKIAEFGTHQSLMELPNGIYKGLKLLQTEQG